MHAVLELDVKCYGLAWEEYFIRVVRVQIMINLNFYTHTNFYIL